MIKDNPEELNELSVSIIIPTLNRADYLKDTIQSLVDQVSSTKQYEIIVVDNGSTDGTKEVVKNAIEKNINHKIRYVFEPIPGLLSGRHRGAREAKNEILTFVDDDILADSNWLTAVIETFQDPQVHFVGGPSLPAFEVPRPKWLSDFWITTEIGRENGYLSLLDLGDRQKEVDPTYVWGLNMSVRKKTFINVGGTHPDFVPKHLQRYQGDGETGLSLRIKKASLKAVYQPLARVLHRIPEERMTMAAFEKRMFYVGICNSFTAIREKKGFQGIDTYQKYKRELESDAFKPDMGIDPAVSVTERNKRLGSSYRAGFVFHQTEVRCDPELLKWVLQNHYLDYRLPPDALDRRLPVSEKGAENE